jgi:arylsulfatase A-like enzyme
MAALVAWIAGGGADARPGPPRAGEGSAGAGDDGTHRAGQGGHASEVKIRLVDALGEAAVEVPALAASQPYFRAYWRKLRGPWAHPEGPAGQLVTTIALGTNAQIETTQWAVATQSGQTWVPDVRVWNMNEGSFDQREAIYAPTPATLRFRIVVPPNARLRFSPAVAIPLQATTLFGASVVDGTGAEHYVSQTRIPPSDDRRWLDADVDLGPWAGQRVELRLRTWTENPTENEKPWAPPADGAGATQASDLEAAERPASPPPMALALWGNPVVVSKGRTRLPYNVVWIVIDALRPDVAPSLHDAAEDAAKLAALRPPLDALLPPVAGLMPAIDRLAARGVHFAHAWSAATWTRPGTLAMLTGERSSEVGIDTSNWVQSTERVAHYYASNPPLVPRLLRREGMTTAAIVNNFFMTGYANVGLDMGFERVTDHRYRTRDTALITYDALAWLEAHASDRFCLFVNYNSPHQPYDPPPEMLARIPAAPAAPKDGTVRAYMAEAAKDDTAVGVLLDKLNALKLGSSTLVILTSDHGETLSAAHDAFGFIGNDKMPMRFHHAVGNFEETTRIPLVMLLPGVIEGGRAIQDRVRSIDIAPTVLDLEGLEPDARMSGRSMLPFIQGRAEPEPRAVVNEGRLSRAILWGRWRLVVHDAPAHPAVASDAGTAPPPEDELYDLDEDPGERRNVARLHADVVADMRARLSAALANAPSVSPASTQARPPSVHFRFAGAGRAHHVAGVLTAGDDRVPATVAIEALSVPSDAVRVTGSHLDFAFPTSPDAVVGFDIHVEPPNAPIVWHFLLDGGPWPDHAVFVGSFGLSALAARGGITTEDARAEVYAPTPPVMDPARDLGVFVTRDAAARPDETAQEAPGIDSEASKEMQRMLQQWGYAHGSH